MASLQSYGAEVLSTNTFNMRSTSTLLNLQAADATALDVANWTTVRACGKRIRYVH